MDICLSVCLSVCPRSPWERIRSTLATPLPEVGIRGPGWQEKGNEQRRCSESTAPNGLRFSPVESVPAPKGAMSENISTRALRDAKKTGCETAGCGHRSPPPCRSTLISMQKRSGSRPAGPISRLFSPDLYNCDGWAWLLSTFGLGELGFSV